MPVAPRIVHLGVSDSQRRVPSTPSVAVPMNAVKMVRQRSLSIVISVLNVAVRRVDPVVEVLDAVDRRILVGAVHARDRDVSVRVSEEHQ